MPVYVQHEALGKINDVFDAHAIWQAPGLALFARRPLLRDLLERSPREQRGHTATRCFSHVTLMLPQEEVDDDRHLSRGARVRDLAQALAALHRKDFGDLLQGDEVRYHVVGAEHLGPGEVEVRFGHAVYLPAPGEAVQYTVSVSRDSAVWKTVCPIYPDQRLTLIGHDDHASTHAAPGWPFGAEGAILLINDGPDAPVEVQVRPRDAFDCSWDAAAGYWTIRSRRGGIDANGAALRLLLRVTPARPAVAAKTAVALPAPETVATPPVVAPPPAVPAATPQPAVWKPRAATDPERTAVPASRASAARPAGAELEATYAPAARQRVTLAALALPRLSRYRETGARLLEIGLNRAFIPVAPGADTLIRFAVDDQDALQAITPAGRERIAVPASFRPVEGVRLELAACAPALAERYCALLRLPHPLAQPVAGGARFTFGRGAPMLAALRVLDSPRFLRHAAGAPPTSADRLGLSRDAFSFEAGPDGWLIARLSATQDLYHLDEQLSFVAAIDTATPEQPYRLPPGHHLVAGHYVLRFDA
jgi:cell division septation protein DedD